MNNLMGGLIMIYYDVDRLSCLKLNPLLSEIHTNLGVCKDIDLEVLTCFPN